MNNIRELNGVIKSITGLESDSPKIVIEFEDGNTITQYHEQDCCESVSIAQVDGVVSRHIGSDAYYLEEKVVNQEAEYESCTATFYTLKTSKGYLDWRWDGISNGYYSESVDFKKIENI